MDLNCALGVQIHCDELQVFVCVSCWVVFLCYLLLVSGYSKGIESICKYPLKG